MTRKIITGIAIACTLTLGALSQANAYSIHNKEGVYKIECDNGVTSSGSTLEITHAQAKHFCAVRGSSITIGDNGGATASDGGKAAKNRAAAATER